jgi:hypothetical protein
MNSLPKEAGGIMSAAHQKRISTNILAAPCTKSNVACPAAWKNEATRLLREYCRTDDTKHLRALVTHVLAMGAHQARATQ